MNVYLFVLLAVFILWQIGFLVAIKLRRNDIADILWGLTFVLASWVAAFCVAHSSFANGLTDFGLAEFLPLIAVTVWGLRLAYYIATRFLKSKEEDRRYHQWRADWGSTWLWRSYLQIFTLQPFLALVIIWPLLRSLNFAPRPVSALIIVGALVWMVGFFFEAVGDAQLARFKKDASNRGKVMDQGLWAWSRHPNYFGEVVQWWGVFLMCIEPNGYWTVLSPITITFFILKVSGVPMLEELMRSRAGYADYLQRVSMFIPLPPKHARRSTKESAP